MRLRRCMVGLLLFVVSCGGGAATAPDPTVASSTPVPVAATAVPAGTVPTTVPTVAVDTQTPLPAETLVTDATSEATTDTTMEATAEATAEAAVEDETVTAEATTEAAATVIGGATTDAMTDVTAAATSGAMTPEATTTDATAEAAPADATAEAAETVVVAPPSPLQVPDGFGVSIYAEDLGSPRLMAYDPDGVLYVTDIDGGRVFALADANRDGAADETQEVLSGLNEPHGIAFHEGALYIAETNQVVRFTRDGDTWGDKEVLVPNLPTGGHRTRTILFGRDGKMYVSIGSSCNVCEESSPLRAAVWQYDADGANGKLFSAGLRNAVGLILRPDTDELWATNNGRDMMGDNVPPETVYVLADGADFGWPRCHAGDIIDPQMGSETACEGVAPPTIEMQAHSAPLGLRFYDRAMFPDEYRGNLFIAFHGS